MNPEGYDPAIYWNDVAERLLDRGDDSVVVAGDDTPFYRTKRQRFLTELLLPAVSAAESVLEVGCGPGGNLAFLIGQGKSVAGADISPVMLQRVQETLGIEGVLTDGRRLSFADRSFPSVFSATVLQHNPNQQADELLLEMARVSSSELHLFEDTAFVQVHDRASHWSRRPSWYVDRVRAAGFELVAMQRLPLACQEVTAATARMVIGRRHREGQRVTRTRRRVEESLLATARLVDRLVPPLLGLTRLSFRRTDATA